MIIAFTGHRSEDCRSEDDVRARVRNALSDTPEAVEAVICGMANGFDLWAAHEAHSLGIPVWVARPWTTHAARVEDRDLYLELVRICSRYHVVETATLNYPGPWVYHKRNEWMVDNATHVMAYWNGKRKGGTFACINYANKVGKPLRNIYG